MFLQSFFNGQSRKESDNQNDSNKGSMRAALDECHVSQKKLSSLNSTPARLVLKREGLTQSKGIVCSPSL